MEEKPQRGTHLKMEGGRFSVREYFRGSVGLFFWEKKNYKKEFFVFLSHPLHINECPHLLPDAGSLDLVPSDSPPPPRL